MPTLELNDSDTTSEYEIDVEDYSTEFSRLSIRLNSVDHDGVLIEPGIFSIMKKN